MTLTLNIPADLARADDTYRKKLRAAAAAMRDAGLITPEQATKLCVVPSANQIGNKTLRQGSPEWSTFRQPGPAHGVLLSLEATGREALYGDNMR